MFWKLYLFFSELIISPQASCKMWPLFDIISDRDKFQSSSKPPWLCVLNNWQASFIFLIIWSMIVLSGEGRTQQTDPATPDPGVGQVLPESVRRLLSAALARRHPLLPRLRNPGQHLRGASGWQPLPRDRLDSRCPRDRSEQKIFSKFRIFEN